MTIGTVDRYKSEAAAVKAAGHLRLSANSDNPNGGSVSVADIVGRFLNEELTDARTSTRQSYESNLKKHILPKWGDYSLTAVKALAVENWLKTLSLAPKTKVQLRNLLAQLFHTAYRYEILPQAPNPMKLVRVRGGSKRLKQPRVLTPEECGALLRELPDEPFRTMVLLAMATGLRCSELSALKWQDVDWDSLTLKIERAIVDNVVAGTKTIGSAATIPLDPAMAELLLRWYRTTDFNDQEDWMFASPYRTGRTPYHPYSVQRFRLRPAAKAAGLGSIGWHDFRHTYSSLLRAAGVDVKVQQELLRHAQSSTTLDLYTQAYEPAKRAAVGKIAAQVLVDSFGHLPNAEAA